MWPGRELSRSRKNWNYSRLSLNGRLESVPAFAYSLYLTPYKTDTSLRRTLSAGPKGARLRESYCIYLIALNTMYAPLDHDAGSQGISI